MVNPPRNMRHSLLLVSALCIAASAGAPAQLPDNGRKAAVQHDDPLLAKVQRAALAMQRQSWEQGILAQAFVEAGDDEMVSMMARGCMIHVAKDGRVATLGGSPLDSLMCGEPLWRAAQISRDPVLQKAADNLLEYVLRRAPRAADGTLYHYGDCMMSDSCHTAAPFLAVMDRHDEALRQVEGYRKRLWDPQKRLWAAVWDERKQQFARKDFWGVGNGWVACTLTRMIRALPADKRAERERLVTYLKEVLDGCLTYQRGDGLFHDVLDKPDTFVEVNLAQMLAFSIYEGVRGGWLPAGYLKTADRMRQAARTKVDRNGLVQGVAGAPDFRHSGVAPEGQAYFLMMETAAKKLSQSKHQHGT